MAAKTRLVENASVAISGKGMGVAAGVGVAVGAAVAAATAEAVSAFDKGEPVRASAARTKESRCFMP